jgi:hypothetical protein
MYLSLINGTTFNKTIFHVVPFTFFIFKYIVAPIYTVFGRTMSVFVAALDLNRLSLYRLHYKELCIFN